MPGLASHQIKVLAGLAIQNICGIVPQSCPEPWRRPSEAAARRIAARCACTSRMRPPVAYLPGGTELRVHEKSRHGPSARALIRLDGSHHEYSRTLARSGSRTGQRPERSLWVTNRQSNGNARLEETAPTDRYRGLPQTQSTCPGGRGNDFLVCADPSAERVQHLYARHFEVARVSRHDDEPVNECSCCDQAILDRQRLAGSAQAGKKFCPTQTRLRVP